MRSLLLLCFICFYQFCFSQAPFQPLSWEEAMQKARREGKLVFVQFESEDCIHCNEVAAKGLSSPEVLKELQAYFVCIRVTPSHPDRKALAAAYNIENSMGSLFLDIDKTLLHTYPKTSTRPGDYTGQIEIARDNAGENLKLAELEKSYQSGNRSPGLLELLIEKKKKLNQPTQVLLDEYVRALPADSLRSERTIRYIAMEAPVLGSRADSVLRGDVVLFSRAWYAIPLQQRVNINNRIISGSRTKAVKEKNEAYALRVASFARSTYNSNLVGGNKAYEVSMLEYYRQVRDTAGFIRLAVPYYNRYLMTVSVDSVKRIDSLRLKEALSKASPEPPRPGDSSNVTMRRSVPFAPAAQNYTSALNAGATFLSRMTNDPALLSIATSWVKRGLEFFDSPDALETYARLLYRQGKTEEAIKVQQQLIDLQKKRKFGTMRQEAVLEAMKNKQPVARPM